MINTSNEQANDGAYTWIDSFNEQPPKKKFPINTIIIIVSVFIVVSITITAVALFFSKNNTTCFTETDYIKLTEIEPLGSFGANDSFYELDVNFEPASVDVTNESDADNVDFKKLIKFLSEIKGKSYEVEITPMYQKGNLDELVRQRSEAINTRLQDGGIDKLVIKVNEPKEFSDPDLEGVLIDSNVLVKVNNAAQCK